MNAHIRQSRPDCGRTYKTVKARFWSLTYKSVMARFWPWPSVQVKAPKTFTHQHGQGLGLGLWGEGIRGFGGLRVRGLEVTIYH